ncbi:prepilin-type N-terminal cleavage/methylation domain-containing protein [Clostridium hydrogeniformans]|uniref:prepilin-type N-terminal cleavage/methylation domain-containing protein n=1 Tax=Clostridium hydrogeniformans TaxID=349933 RepID=UPI0004835A22|nr:prepilin-type N-terminal cleavage/methylation domain-containing protein [Clostridium hydrogeniformans]
MYKRKGATLVELMAAIVIFIIILSMVSSFVMFIIRINNKSKDISLEEELIKQTFIVINTQIKNNKEIRIDNSKITILKESGVYEISLSKLGNLVINRSNNNKVEIIGGNIKDIRFYKKDNLLYIYIALRGGKEFERAIPI